jgi:hypothetical protein
MVSVVGVIIFVAVIYRLLTDGVPAGAQTWKVGEFFDTVATVGVSTTLDWVQESPPAIHTYEELPYIVYSPKN